MSRIKVGSLVRVSKGKFDVPLYDDCWSESYNNNYYFERDEVGIVMGYQEKTHWGNQVQVITASGAFGWNNEECFEVLSDG